MNLQLQFSMPGVRVTSEANLREHWAKRFKRKKHQQAETHLAWTLAAPGRISLPCVVRLTRIGSRRLDSDNLAGGFKHIRDAIAKAIGIDDGSELIRFEYQQEAIGKREYAVKVEVYQRGGGIA
jgi:hypothetical protein